jgi:hypothetical protein
VGQVDRQSAEAVVLTLVVDDGPEAQHPRDRPQPQQQDDERQDEVAVPEVVEAEQAENVLGHREVVDPDERDARALERLGEDRDESDVGQDHYDPTPEAVESPVDAEELQPELERHDSLFSTRELREC